jgi:hypothetical protein
MGKLALVAPDGTVMFGGTTAYWLLDESVIVRPDAAAAPDSVTVPTVLVPPIKELELADTAARVAVVLYSQRVPPFWAPPVLQGP